MKKSKTWQLAVIVLIVLAALYVDLNIGHSDYVKNLIFWRPASQRDIALRFGLDLQGGIQTLLTANVPAGQEPDAASLEATRLIIEKRAQSLLLTTPVVQTLNERHIIVDLPGSGGLRQTIDTLQATGVVEFIDAGALSMPPGTIVETTLGGPSTEEPTAPVTPTARIFTTVLSNDDLAAIMLRQTGTNQYNISFALTEQATPGFTIFTAGHSGQYLCVAIDKEVISCAFLPDSPLEGGGGIPVFLSDAGAQRVDVLLRYGSLPVPMQVEELETIGPALGETAVQQGGRAAIIGLIAVLVFLLLNYRLPGLLADLAMLVLVLFNIALCKLIPLPLTLPSITGFAMAALLATGAHLSILERVREEMRAGRPLPRAVENGFSRAWSSIRNGHLTFLALSIAMWYTGATTSADLFLWLGVTLLVGVLTSLLVTMVVTRVFIRSAFEAGREWLSERQWLLGI